MASKDFTAVTSVYSLPDRDAPSLINAPILAELESGQELPLARFRYFQGASEGSTHANGHLNLSALQRKEIKSAYLTHARQYFEQIFKPLGKPVLKSRMEAAKSANPGELANVLAELESLIGIYRAKSEIKELISLVRVGLMRQAVGKAGFMGTLHVSFVGNPGTGKTTVARIYAKALKALGVLQKDTFVECSRADLVAGYLGQTAIKTREVIDRADGGVLFIDEAYSLVKGSSDSYGQEALAELIKQMEDRRDRLAVILAGYPNEIDALMKVNPGLASRVPQTVHFEDYNGDELLAILKVMANVQGYTLQEGCDEPVLTQLAKFNGDTFGNARGVRNLLEHAVRSHAVRISVLTTPSADELSELTLEDLMSGSRELL